jgi:hypothetical protein
MLAEVNPLPPALVETVEQSIPVGPAAAIEEKLPACAKGERTRRQTTHNADKPSNAFIAIPLRSVLS